MPSLGAWPDTLRALDPLLSIRWGTCVGKWIIERKAVTPIHELKWQIREREWNDREIAAGRITGPELSDCRALEEEIVSLQRGYRVIVMADQLNPALYDMLAMSDIKRYGGYCRYADMQEKKWEERKRKKLAARSARLDDMNAECFGNPASHQRGIYGYLRDKRRVAARNKFVKGQISLAEALGLPRGADVLGRGGDKTVASDAPRIKIVSR